jgi:hypothetical protein
MPSDCEQFQEAIGLALAYLDEADFWLEHIKQDGQGDEQRATVALECLPAARSALEQVQAQFGPLASEDGETPG